MSIFLKLCLFPLALPVMENLALMLSHLLFITHSVIIEFIIYNCWGRGLSLES